MIPKDFDLQQRRPVWEAISDLWIDNELSDMDYRYMAKVLLASGYSLKELEEIYLYEVSPVVWTNLFPFLPVIPDVWSGFDPEWLEEEILKNIERQRKNTLYRLYITSRFGKWMRTLVVKGDWAKVLNIIQSDMKSPRGLRG